jgi:hypothetical protein
MIAWMLFFLSAQIAVDGHVLEVDVARKEEEQKQGLMGREELKEGTGMLFVYEKPHILAFWMKNMKIPLSIGFFDSEGRLLHVEDMEPPRNPANLPIYESRRPALYALEVPKQWFQRHQIQPGAKLVFQNSSKRVD